MLSCAWRFDDIGAQTLVLLFLLLMEIVPSRFRLLSSSRGRFFFPSGCIIRKLTVLLTQQHQMSAVS